MTNAISQPDNTIAIPLHDLKASPNNVRRTNTQNGIEALAASIQAHGLLQNLNVHIAENGAVEVVAGQRRLLALQHLAATGAISSDYPVPCQVLSRRSAAQEISLAENAMRQAMHPDDEYEAFNSLVSAGMPVDDVAARYGVTPAVVKQRMKLAAVSPKLRKLFRAGKMTLSHIMAFTLTDDVKKQEKAWKDLSEWEREDPDNIKAILTDSSVAATHKLARFVGVKAYEKAGGTVMRDLFSEEASTYLTNPELLQELAQKKLEAHAEKLQAEGWGWVKATLDNAWDGPYARLTPTNAPAADADIDEDFEYDDDNHTFDPEQMKAAGAKVFLDYNGQIAVSRGLVRPEAEQETDPTGQANPVKQKPEYSARLMDELAHQKTTAMRYALSQDPKASLAALAHTLASQVLYQSYTTTALNIRATSVDTERPEVVPNRDENTAANALEAQRLAWKKRLPKDDSKLFGWLMKQDQAALTDLLVFASALTLQATIPGNGMDADRREASEQVTKQLTPRFTMADYWEATAEGFISRMSKSQMAKALEETGQTPLAERVLKMKRDEAIRETARALKGKGWLPTPLQSPQGARSSR